MQDRVRRKRRVGGDGVGLALQIGNIHSATSLNLPEKFQPNDERNRNPGVDCRSGGAIPRFCRSDMLAQTEIRFRKRTPEEHLCTAARRALS
jgi:hypothetical protein